MADRIDTSQYAYFGANLRRLRRERDISQAAIGNAAGGLSQTYISMLEHGRIPRRSEYVDALARALRVPRALLLSEPAAPRFTAVQRAETGQHVEAGA